jgi:DNA sulfur modification protein DndD
VKLLEITLQNFMPYKGQQRIEFPSDESRNAMVVFGDNMRGKTSLLNSIRWCFYGEALDRDLRKINLPDISNMDARAEGDWTFSVFAKFESGGHRYDLRRVARPREHVHTPRHDSDFDVETGLTRDDQVIRGDEIEHEINQLMPHQISRFFLFDAELLAEYQGLLIEDSEQGKRIKQAIEQVLGVPALVNGRDEMRTLLKKAQAVLAKENKHTEGLRAQADQYAKLEAELEALVKDLEELQGREAEYRREITALDAVLAQTEAAQKAQAQMNSLEGEQKRLLQREADLQEESADAASQAWRDLLQPRVRLRLEQLRSDMAEYQRQMEERGALVARVSQMRKILDSSTCALCEQEISPQHREHFGSELGTLEGKLGLLTSNLERVGTLSSEIDRLSRITGTGAAARLKRIETEMSRIAVDLVRTESQIENLKEEVRGYDTAEIARLRSLRDQLTQNLGRLSEDLKRTQREITDRQNKQDQLTKMMSRAPMARSQRSAREVEIYGELERLFGDGVGILRDKLRDTVARHATDAFLKLTTEKTYFGLSINDNYGLTIIDRERRPVEIRSAGAEQIVALSLIDGLNRTARKAGPIIIDTPLGRLDPKHRANVLAYLPSMAEQIVLLVHEGEIDRSNGLDPLANRIGAVYEIERVSSSHSQLRRS